ncbi:hypothetical protein ACA910_010578 [Epithemia clementina (nom. ined.)]
MRRQHGRRLHDDKDTQKQHLKMTSTVHSNGHVDLPNTSTVSGGDDRFLHNSNDDDAMNTSTRIVVSNNDNVPSASSWNGSAIAAAITLCLGTSLSQLFYQHVSNAAPQYFFSIAVILPLSGLICYPTILVVLHLWGRTRNIGSDDGNISGSDSSSDRPNNSRSNACNELINTSTDSSISDQIENCGTVWLYYKNRILPSLRYCLGIGACFALHNLLVDFGKSGSQVGVPDVSTVLSMVLQKLVVPVSLLLEATLDRRNVTAWEISGVATVMLGILSTALLYQHQQHNKHEQDGLQEDVTSNGSVEESSLYGLKILCLCLSSVPLALGFYIVSVARRTLPQVSGIELWALLCIPEFLFSIFFVLLCSRSISSGQSHADLWRGIACVVAGVQPPPPSESRSGSALVADCRDAAKFFWTGFPFSLAFNLAIPILVKLKGPTSVPLFRAVALPLASLLAMTHLDPVIATPFSWNVVLGVLLCTAGLILFYYPHENNNSNAAAASSAGYSPLDNIGGNETDDNDGGDNEDEQVA